MKLKRLKAKAYSYQVFNKGKVIGIGKTESEAWENAARALADNLFVIRTTLNELLEE